MLSGKGTNPDQTNAFVCSTPFQCTSYDACAEFLAVGQGFKEHSI